MIHDTFLFGPGLSFAAIFFAAFQAEEGLRKMLAESSSTPAIDAAPWISL